MVLHDTGRLTVQKKNTVPNEVLSLIDFDLSLDTYVFENESGHLYNEKDRLYIRLQFWTEKLLLSDSVRFMTPS